jgi:hypothetical protein
MFLSAPIRLRSPRLVFGIGLGLSGLWMLLPELLRPKPVGLPFDRNDDEAAAARRIGAVYLVKPVSGRTIVQELKSPAEN